MACINQAMEWLDKGQKLFRAEWAAKSAYIYLEQDDQIFVNWDGTIHEYGLRLSDLTATDWEIYKEINFQTVTSFKEACSHMDQGGLAERSGVSPVKLWRNNFYIEATSARYALTYLDVMATDWVLL